MFTKSEDIGGNKPWQKKVEKYHVTFEATDQSQSINKVSIDSEYGLIHVRIQGSAVKNLYDAIKASSLNKFTKGRLPALIECNFGELSIYVRGIHNENPDDVGLVINTIYEQIINSFAPPFVSIKEEINQQLKELGMIGLQQLKVIPQRLSAIDQILSSYDERLKVAALQKPSTNAVSTSVSTSYAKTVTKAILDCTDPNNPLFSSDDIHYYQEAKIIKTILNETMTPQLYEELFLLVNSPVPDQHTIIKSTWSAITTCTDYTAFKTKEAEIRQSVLIALANIEQKAALHYTAAQGIAVPLLKSDLDRLDQGMLTKLSRTSTILNSQQIEVFKQDNYNQMMHYKNTGKVVTDRAYLQAEQDAAVGSTYTYSHDNWKAYEYHKRVDDIEFPKLRSIIRKMRFLNEFNQPGRQVEYEKVLKQKIFSSAVRLYGMCAMEKLETSYSRKMIQEELDKQLLNEMSRQLHSTGITENLETIHALIQHGAHVNQFALRSDYPLLLDAIFSKSYHIANLLIDSGADIEYYRKHHFGNALMLSIKQGAPLEFMERLLLMTKNMSVKDPYGRTLLCLAIEVSSPIINTLMQHGVSLLEHCDDGNTALMTAVNYKNTALVRQLLETAPALINMQNNAGNTALMAMQYNREPAETCAIIDILIQSDTDISITNKAGQTIKEIAQRWPQAWQSQLEASLLKKEMSQKSDNEYYHGMSGPM